MNTLTDYTKLSPKKFWEIVATTEQVCSDRFLKRWEQAKEEIPSQDDAIECLNDLFIYSHSRLSKFSKELESGYPTKQFTKDKLAKVEDLWWVDHFTAGISQWSTLNWFSSTKRKRKNGTIGYAGASTHFVQGYHDHPFYIIPLMHGAWHEPHRNADSFSIEHVNAGMLKQKDNDWHYWAGKLPQSLVQELPPVLLDKPYRGVTAMQAFTPMQFINNIVLKRIIIAALPGKLDLCRMSQHSDWREGKTDMGPLWLFENCNNAAFSPEPIPELEFLQQQEYTEMLDEKGTIWNEATGWDKHDDVDNPEYGETTPTHDGDPDPDADKVLSVKEIQKLLVRKGYDLTIDGVPGRHTMTCVKAFQLGWNMRHSQDLLKVDGIPGPKTCERLKK